MEKNIVELRAEQNTTIESTASANSMILNPAVMKQIDMVSEMMASGISTVPKHLQAKKADCFAIVLQAAQWGMNPFAVAQKTHLINGTLGYEAQLVNAVISSSNVIKGRFKYEYDGDWSKVNKGSTACIRVGAILSGDTNITWGEWLFVGDVTTKNSPLWNSAPKQQAGYLAVKYWSRLYCPEVILGVYSQEEFEPETEKEINPIVKESIQGDAIRTATLENIVERISSAKDMIDLKSESLINDMKSLPEHQIKESQSRWTDRKNQLKAEFDMKKKSPALELPLQIESCKTAEELSEFLKNISEADQLKYGDVIDMQYDSFR